MIGGPKAYAAPALPAPGPVERSDEAVGGGVLWLALTAEAEGVAVVEGVGVGVGDGSGGAGSRQ